MKKQLVKWILMGAAVIQGGVPQYSIRAEGSIQEETEWRETKHEKEEEEEAVTVQERKSTIRYSPQGYRMWDGWCVKKGEEVHLIHLKGLAYGMAYDEEKESKRGYGHAVSPDLVHWTEQDDILTLEETENDLDREFRYTGSTIEYNDLYYTFYTMRKGQGQRIGVATSPDLYEWEEYAGNPVLVPDEEWFITFANENVSNHASWGGTVDCRDMVVVKDEEGEGFWGYFVASADRGLTTPTAVVGVAYSTDLFHWEQLGIAYAPEGVAMPEMVDVFQVGDKWYMTLTTAKNNGGISVFSDPYITRAQIYAAADSPKGPFAENPQDNVLMGGQLDSGYSSRTILYKGKRRILYVDSNHGESVVSLPKNVDADEDGRLRLYYADDLLGNIRKTTLEDGIAVQANTSFAWNTRGGEWKKKNGEFSCITDKESWQPFLMKGMASNLELTFCVSADSDCTSYGIVLSGKGSGKLLEDLEHILVIDRTQNRIYLTDSQWEFANCREYQFEEYTEYRFRMLLVGNTIELYINDELVFNSGIDNQGANRAGLFVNDGSIRVTELMLYGLEDK